MTSQSSSLSGIHPTLVLALVCWLGMSLVLIVLGWIHAAAFTEIADMDIRVFYDAALAVRNGDDLFAAYSDDPYLTYIYPPLLAIVFTPLTLLSLESAAVVWTVISVLLLAACLVFGGRNFLKRFKARIDVATLPVVLFISVLLFFPRIKAELDQGQIDFIVLLAIILGLIWINRYPVLAGIALGLAANIKYQTIIFLPFFVVRGWWSAAIGFIAGALAGVLSGVLVFGWYGNLDYLRRAFAGMASMLGLPAGEGPLPVIRPMDWGDSLSLASTFARWSDHGAVVIGMIGLAALICFLFAWLLYRINGQSLFCGRTGLHGRTDESQQPLIALEWLGLLVAMVAFAPQTKMRHLVFLLPVIMLTVQLLVVRRQGVWRLPLLISLIVMMIGFTLPPGSPESMAEWREQWRREGGPTWCALLVFFTMLWTGLRWVRSSQQMKSECP
ncbi:MAG: glycosyltransferase family 87 protein [Phycisphaerales bacterium]|nr:glycosyltransferase family 87 protein [Phycisphaerales bacterium]